ncbi:MAG: cyclic pyranopterin monophosphate synthase MoaC [Bacteroidales bacterium]
MSSLTHINWRGEAAMVDVSDKNECQREALAYGFIQLQPDTLKLIRDNLIKKGDVYAVARVAAIQAIKRTWDTIPLCHHIPLSTSEVVFEESGIGVACRVKVKAFAVTGVEMEALYGVQVALLTIYDMCKAVDKHMVISNVHLVHKTKS